jgi:hypothetical protein
MTSQHFATDCKQTEFFLTVIAPCEVAGVAYGPGDTVRVATKRASDHLIGAGAAVASGGTITPEHVAAPVVPAPASNRIIRKRAGKAKS